MKIITTKAKLAAAFQLWDERYRAAPDTFMNEAYRLLFETAEDYGDPAAEYFVSLLEENK